ncbi:hypothetical protein [Agriterribacter sp.]|uniref:hypothetical protein n=1 Tax=Agriterribacter sp. TaxID=2821509 RepID=UPI002BE9DE5C|nr:hypothetical protein [Agriterribacter sp.]HRO46979.1 hypothetical protein [Agriterribacter sp.]HRQ18453.1 hypothetical protein [Agriterribacter sp.]
MNVLRKLVFIFMFFVLVKNGFSQEQYYIYIQSQNHQSFYSRIGSETFTSSGNGYLLLPGLTKNTYELIIGFPGAKISEWRFNCTVNDTDLGFILKDAGVAGVQLLHLDQKGTLTGKVVEQHMEVKANIAPLPGVISDDPFSAMLAGVVNDPSIRQQLVIVDKKTAPVNNDTGESSITGAAPAVPVSVSTDNNKPAEPVASAVLQEEIKTSIAESETKKNETFVVREIEKTNSAEAEKLAATGAVQKGDKTVAANTQKQYEPFVVKEVTEPVNAGAKTENVGVPAAAQKRDSGVLAAAKEQEPFVVKEVITKRNDAETRQTAHTATKKDADNNETVKYLPFVIKPADKTDNNEAAKSSNALTEKKADSVTAVAAEKKPLPPVKSGDNPGQAEKDKTVKSGTEIPANGSATATQKGKPAPDVQKAILSAVKKTLERKSRDGVDLIYVDENVNGAKDTIRIFIPVLK